MNKYEFTVIKTIFLAPDLISHLNEWVNKMINKKNMMGLITIVFMVLISAVPTFAAQTTTQTATVTVSDTIAIEALFSGTQNADITLGTLAADNAQTTVSGEVIRTRSNVAIDVSTRASGDFSDGGTPANTIALSNFLYDGDTANHVFTTGNTAVFTNWAKAPKATGYADKSVPLKITIPYGTDPGTYTTTVYFTASKHTG